MIPKYRMWNRITSTMHHVEGLYFDNKEVQYIDEVGILRFIKFENTILMQSTGLKDKNGKEIFEGDIITTNAYGCIVSFGEYTYFEDEDTQTTEVGFYLSFLNVTPATYAPFEKFYWDNCEVIGNIHENELDLIMYELHKYNKALSEVE